ncbi:MAG: DUF4230 domain-containing protein [Muribaculaceae bacterium]|nr:DUF4230 domain-containing protein [Muribaculaceae bacterium]
MKTENEKERVMKSYILMILAVLAFVGCSPRKGDPTLNFYDELHSVSRLELGKMTVSKVGTITDPPPASAKGVLQKTEAVFNSLKVGTRVGVYSYDTYFVAYIDLQRLQPGDITVDEELKKVYVSLPPIEVMTDGREVELHEEHSRVTGFRSAITPAERARLKSRMAAEVEREVAADATNRNRLKATAEAKAKKWIAEFIRQRGYEAEVTIPD